MSFYPGSTAILELSSQCVLALQGLQSIFLHNLVTGQAAQGKDHWNHQPKQHSGKLAGSKVWPALKFSIVKVTHNVTMTLRKRNLVTSAQ